jgi:cytochrome c oxidase accessory protein FixG
MTDRIPVKDVTAIKVTPEKSDPSRSSENGHIYVRAVKGPLENFRRFFGLFFVGLFALLPWLQYDDRQAILLDIAAQRFYIFSITFWPQDLTLFAWLVMIAAFALFFITTFAGRVWCGFMCPQTAWTFMFIWFEEKIEGNRNKRIKLDQRKMDLDKFWRKSVKQLCWISIALLTALTFVGYFTPIGQLFVKFFTLEAAFWSGFFVLFFTFCTYGNAAYMREIMCTHMCPYARFQSSMFDKDTFTVTYDYRRGENRGPRSRKATREKNQEKGLGDCIDCNLCVQVCPTGIDIRDGLQYECINCGACVDVCNGVMANMNYPEGLIRYTSEHTMDGGKTEIIRPKLVAYALVLSFMVGLLGYQLANRIPLDLDIIRDRNALYRETNDGLIENVYTLKIMNKSQVEKNYQIKANGLPEHRLTINSPVRVAPGEVFTLPASIAIDPYKIENRITSFYFEVSSTQTSDIQIAEPAKFIYR